MAVQSRKWTMMVYLAGDNNLASAGSADLTEMKQAGSNDAIALVAQFDNAEAHHTTRRYYLRKETRLAEDVVQELGPTNTGDPAVLLDFVTWAVQKYPAERYALVLWNHGNGWDDENVYRVARRNGIAVSRKGIPVEGSGNDRVPLSDTRAVSNRPLRRALFQTPVLAGLRTRGILYDDNAKDFLDSVEMKNVLQDIKAKLQGKLDILGMDACLMSMVEVLYQARDTVAVAIGSEQTEPGDGWPYDTVLRELVNNPTMSAAELSATIVNKYLKSYDASSQVTQASTDLGKLQMLAGAIDLLSKAMIGKLADEAFRGKLLEVREQVQHYETEDYVDLCDFCELLEGTTQDPGIRSACAAVTKLFGTNGIVIESGCKGEEVKHSHGISIYFPKNDISNLYVRLDFTRDSKWDEFLAAYHQGMLRREPPMRMVRRSVA